MTSLGEPIKIQGRVGASYVRLVLEKQGYQVQFREHDNGVDLQVNRVATRKTADGKNREYTDGWQMDIQVKTALDSSVSFQDGNLVYDLEAKNYDDLIMRRAEMTTPLALVLVVLPADKTSWVNIKEAEILLQKHMYWYVPPAGSSLTQNSSSVRLKLDVNQRVDNTGFEKLLATHN